MDFKSRMDYRRSGLPKRYWERDMLPDAKVLGYMVDLPEILGDLTSQIFGQGLVLVGDRATEQAAVVFRHYMESQDLGVMGVRALFLDFWSWSESAKDFDFRNVVLAEALEPGLVVFDRVSLIRTDFVNSGLRGVVKGRFDQGKPTVLTASGPMDQVRSSLASCLDFDPSAFRFVETLATEG